MPSRLQVLQKELKRKQLLAELNKRAGLKAEGVAKKDGTLTRLGKQIYNTTIAAPVLAVGTKSGLGKTNTAMNTLIALQKDVQGRFGRGEPLTQKEVDRYSKYDGWGQVLKRDYEAGFVEIRPEHTQQESEERLRSAAKEGIAKTTKDAWIGATVSEASGFKDKAVDVIAGITGFTLQLAALKKAFPTVHPSVIWEMQSQATGNTPGKGALTYAAFATPGMVIKGASKAAKVGRVGAESAMLGSMSAVEQGIETGEIDPVQVLVAAGIPVAMRGPKAAKLLLKKLIKDKNPAVMSEMMRKAGERPGAGKTLGATRKGVPIREGIKPGAAKEIVDVPSEFISWAKTVELVQGTERKAAVKKLRKQQTAGGIEAKEALVREGVPVGKAITLSKRGMKIKAAVPEVKSAPNISPEKWAALERKVDTVYPTVEHMKKVNAVEALNKLRTRRIPTPYEFSLLEPVLGEEVATQLHQALASKRPFSGWEIPPLLIQGGKTIFSLDIQTARQGRSVALRHPITYTAGILKNVIGYANTLVGGKYVANEKARLQAEPGYKESTKYLNYVTTTPYQRGKRLEQFSMGLTERMVEANFKNKVLNATAGKGIRGYGHLIASSESGASVGINHMMKRMWDSGMKQLAKVSEGMTPAQQKQWKVNRGKAINRYMKVVRAKGKKGVQVQQAANYLLFSPSVTVSRPLQIASIATLKGSRTYSAELLVSNLITIYAIAAIPNIIARHQRLKNPTREPDIDGGINALAGDFGKVRKGSTVYDFTGGDAPFYRTLARLGVSAYLYAQKKITGKEQSVVAGERVKDMGETLKRYGETRETAVIGLVTTLASGKDWVGNPISGIEALQKAITPEVLQATIEAGMADGTWAALAAAASTTASAGVDTYAVPATVTRSNFRDVVAEQTYKKGWDELGLSEQKRLENKHRKEFEQFQRQISKERVTRPYNPEKIIEEERESGIYIRKLLSKPNQRWVESVSVNVSRRPKTLYLNDERYQKYKDLVAKYLNESLNKRPPSGSDRRKNLMVESAIKIAKKRAYSELKIHD